MTPRPEAETGSTGQIRQNSTRKVSHYDIRTKLRYGWSAERIADHYGISVQTIWKRVGETVPKRRRRMRKKLRLVETMEAPAPRLRVNEPDPISGFGVELAIARLNEISRKARGNMLGPSGLADLADAAVLELGGSLVP